jgi:flavin reductase (DIM6/NTAB) family NADH-FMN oxidoreductase RutF
MHYSEDNLESLNKNFRRNLINSLLGLKPALLIGTQNKKGQTNLAVFSQVFHLGASPPLLGIIFRPDSVERHTLNNIRENKVFSMNHVHQSWVNKAHQTSARYPLEISEFDAVGLEREYLPGLEIPFVKNAKLKMFCHFEEEHSLMINNTILLIASIKEIFIEDDGAISSDGFIDIEKLESSAVVGLDAYYSANLIARYKYAKPNNEAEEIN